MPPTTSDDDPGAVTVRVKLLVVTVPVLSPTVMLKPKSPTVLGVPESVALTKVKPAGRLVVISSPALRTGDEHAIDSGPLLLGREGENDLALVRDEFTSSRHARVEPRRDGVWVEDIGSTNGTYVNGVRLTAPRKLSPGDVIRVGETDLRFER